MSHDSPLNGRDVEQGEPDLSQNDSSESDPLLANRPSGQALQRARSSVEREIDSLVSELIQALQRNRRRLSQGPDISGEVITNDADVEQEIQTLREQNILSLVGASYVSLVI